MIRNKLEDTVEIYDGDQLVKSVEIYVTRPNNKVNREADMLRSKTWSDCTSEGIPTKKQVLELMVERGEWDVEKQNLENKLGLEIVELERKLYCGEDGKKPKLSEGREIAIQIRQKRFQLRNLISQKIALEEHSAENLADNARFDFLVAHCSFYKNGTPIYSSFDEYNKQSADEIAFAAASLLGKMMYNIDNNFEANLPENKFLKKFGLVNDKLSLIDPNTGFTVDIAGKRIDEDGFYVDEEGNRIDGDGHRITQDGFYEMVEYENDLVIEKPKPKRKTTVKKTTKKTTETTDSTSG
jgi:hypothetical protein